MSECMYWKGRISMGNVKQNFKRSCLNWGMLAAIVIPLILFIESLYEGGLLHAENIDILSAYAQPMALSNYVQFACLFPVLPFAFSFCEDKNSGYLKYILQRIDKKQYIRNRIFWCGISGGISSAVPSAILFLFLIFIQHPASADHNSAYYPSHLQGMIWEPYIGMWGGILILLLKLLLVFLFGVFWAEIALLISMIICNRYMVFMIVFAIYLVTWMVVPSKYSVLLEVFLLRGDFYSSMPLCDPYLIQVGYIVCTCAISVMVFRRKKFYE